MDYIFYDKLNIDFIKPKDGSINPAYEFLDNIKKKLIGPRDEPLRKNYFLLGSTRSRRLIKKVYDKSLDGAKEIKMKKLEDEVLLIEVPIEEILKNKEDIQKMNYTYLVDGKNSLTFIFAKELKGQPTEKIIGIPYEALETVLARHTNKDLQWDFGFPRGGGRQYPRVINDFLINDKKIAGTAVLLDSYNEIYMYGTMNFFFDEPFFRKWLTPEELARENTEEDGVGITGIVNEIPSLRKNVFIKEYMEEIERLVNLYT